MSFTNVTIQATIFADRKKVWEYYNQPEHITHWNFASPEWHCPRAENELKIGGKLKSRMEARDGSMGFDFVGTYEKIDEFNSLRFSLDDGRRVDVEFSDQGNKTQVVTHFDAESSHPVEMQQQGWQAILNNFKKYVESA